MRLLDARALIHEGVSRLVDDDEVGRPHYAILSHTWGQEEVLFEDIALGPDHEIDSPNEEQRTARGDRPDSRFYGKRFEPNVREAKHSYTSKICENCRPGIRAAVKQQGSHVKAGWKKIWSVCLQACRDGYDFVWVDTCCIDKSSSSELAEALNSMFKWYAQSATCYVLLEDCRLCPNRFNAQRIINSFPSIAKCTEAQIKRCRWLTRGWTLQELIAPSEINFLDQEWSVLGSRRELADILSGTTGIAKILLSPMTHIPHFRYMIVRKQLESFPIASKMSWAALRKTTRVEDKAYSLLGLFGVNMTLLYGEGDGAFIRLQEEIIKCSNDDSIFAWEFMSSLEYDLFAKQLLSPSPNNFSWLRQNNGALSLFGTKFLMNDDVSDKVFEITQKALNITTLSFHRRNENNSSKITRHYKKKQSLSEIQAKKTSQFKKNGEDSRRNDSNKAKSNADRSNKEIISEERWSEESSPYEASIQEQLFKDRMVTNNLHAAYLEDQMLLKCYVALPSDDFIVKVYLRITHEYMGGRYVISQVSDEKPKKSEIERERSTRERIGLRLGSKYRLTFCEDREQRKMLMDDMRSITIRRNFDQFDL